MPRAAFARTALVLAIALISLPTGAEEISFGVPGYGPDRASIFTAAVAGSRDGYVAVWVSYEGDRLFARAFDRTGQPVDETHLVGLGADSDPPVVVRVGDRYRLLWMSTDFRYGVSPRLEVVDLDDRGQRIEGSERRLADDVFRIAAATDGARTLVVTDESFRRDDGHLRWFLLEPSGDVRQGSIWVGDTSGHQVVARNGDFDIVWSSGGELWRFQLFAGKLERVPSLGRPASFAATTDGETLWIATSYVTTTALTIVGTEDARTVTLTTGRRLGVQGAYFVDGEVVVTASEADGNFLVRADGDGNLLQLLDMKLDKGRLFGVVEGDDSLLALARTREPGPNGLSTVRLQRVGGMVSAPGTAEVLSVIAGSQFAPVLASSSTGRSLLVWAENVTTGDGPLVALRGALLDDVSGALGEPIEIAALVSTPLAVVASGDRFLVHYRTETLENRVALLDFGGNVVSDMPLPFGGQGSRLRWAWSGSRFIAVEDRSDSILLHAWDGTSVSEPFEVGRAEETAPDLWSTVASASVAVGERTILVSWASIVSGCYFPVCYNPRKPFVRLFDRETLEPVSEALPVGERNHLRGIEAAWGGGRYALFSESRGTLVRLTEDGTLVDDDEIAVRGTSGFTFTPSMTIAGLDGAFAVVWYEQNWTRLQGIAMRVVNGDGSVSPIRAFPVLTHTLPLTTAASGGDLWIAYTRMVPDDVYDGATRVFARRLSDVPETAPPRPPRLRTATIIDEQVMLQWDDESDDEAFFEIRWSVPFPNYASCRLTIAPANATSASVNCRGEGPYTFRVVGWNAAGWGEPSEEVTAVPPERRRGVRRE